MSSDISAASRLRSDKTLSTAQRQVALNGIRAETPKHQFVVDVEGIVHGTSRMVIRDIQCTKVVEIVLDLRPLVHLEAGAAKDRHDRADRTAAHLILLAKDNEGYKNLINLVTKAHLEGFYYHPRVDMELLSQHHSGLIALSACLKGRIPYLLNHNRPEDAKRETQILASIFDKDRFYFAIVNFD